MTQVLCISKRENLQGESWRDVQGSTVCVLAFDFLSCKLRFYTEQISVNQDASHLVSTNNRLCFIFLVAIQLNTVSGLPTCVGLKPKRTWEARETDWLPCSSFPALPFQLETSFFCVEQCQIGAWDNVGKMKLSSFHSCAIILNLFVPLCC